MNGIDTNVLLRWLFGDMLGEDVEAEMSAIRNLVLSSEAPLHVNHIVIAETIWVLARRTKRSRAAIVTIIDRILDAPEIRVQDEEAVRAAARAFAHSTGDFSDHLIGEINSRNGCRTTYTFDRAAARSPLFSELSR
ncbi:PIN domain-containing protein [Rhizobium sp. NFR03]|uniref:PIN domain-containing protein n=1 Tax=Rhizobium sp. NFR03 TaxID=1566263 RepID=UPI0008D04792|nr:PIN domain-containing protein [Rhizobium sp. NFR03]SER64794.1 Predicted nucleic-acid-binding protein, contains PIN domain [Rhizobium sp. NFR03]